MQMSTQISSFISPSLFSLSLWLEGDLFIRLFNDQEAETESVSLDVIEYMPIAVCIRAFGGNYPNATHLWQESDAHQMA